MIDLVTVLSGHSATVASCGVNQFSTLATGTEAGAVHTYDLTANSVLSILKLPKLTGVAVASLAFHPIDSSTLFASAEHAVHKLDLRSSAIVQTFDYAKDDVNGIAVNAKGNFLAVGDDAGAVHVVDLVAGRLYKTVRQAHDSLCVMVTFRPHRPWELVSGGLDMTCARWEFSRGRCLERWPMSQMLNADEAAEDGSERQLFNPPMVHHLVCPPTDDRRWCGHVAAACGDGSVVVWDADQPQPRVALQSRSASATKASTHSKKSGIRDAKPATAGGGTSTSGDNSGPLVLGRDNGGHTRSVSCVAWCQVAGRWHLLSAGQDRRLLLWDVAGAQQLRCDSELGTSASFPDPTADGRGGGMSLTTGSHDVGGASGTHTGSMPMPVAEVGLKRKPNGLCIATVSGKQLACIADTGRTVAVYQVHGA